ncbi:MAG: Gfo/Idh/MocA family oxidoreductase [Rhodothermales bacterium]
MLKLLTFFLVTISVVPLTQAQLVTALPDEPLRVGVVGLVHAHVGWILGRADRGDIEIVGIVEPNRELAERYARQYGYSMDLVYADLEAMLDATQPEAVTVFTSIKDHRRVTEICAERGVHVMVEKPLAVNLEDAQAMAEAAERGGIHLLTNYETTWYPSVHEAHRLYTEGALGPLRKMVVMDGHFGPEEIGVGPEFLEWLIDPAYNGAGALTDFGCYGANLMTWFMGNERPLTVTAITQTIKPERYPLVDDEATIIVTYPEAQGIIQASWNWPYHRKDMEVYGATGVAIATGGQDLRLRPSDPEPWTSQDLPIRPRPFDDPFSYLEAVVRGRLAPTGDLSSLENNMIVMEILDAAMQSAKTGQTVVLER